MYHWNLGGGAPHAVLKPSPGLHFVDPTPIATHTIGADALEGKSCILLRPTIGPIIV